MQPHKFKRIPRCVSECWNKFRFPPVQEKSHFLETEFFSRTFNRQYEISPLIALGFLASAPTPFFSSESPNRNKIRISARLSDQRLLQKLITTVLQMAEKLEFQSAESFARSIQTYLPSSKVGRIFSAKRRRKKTKSFALKMQKLLCGCVRLCGENFFGINRSLMSWLDEYLSCE